MTSVQPLQVLVVDDDRDAAKTLAMRIEQMGHAAHCVYRPETALSSALKIRPHVVFLDLGMPIVDGFKLAQAIRHAIPDPALQLVAISGHDTPELRAYGRSCGFDKYLVKPPDFADIERILNDLFGGNGPP